jgi:signal transduction histidine kinase
LTNVLKHADAKSATVTLDFDGPGLVVEVVDDAESTRPLDRPAAEQPPGHGLVGMRERVALLGGELQAGHHADGGFRVIARLPVGGGS